MMTSITYLQSGQQVGHLVRGGERGALRQQPDDILEVLLADGLENRKHVRVVDPEPSQDLGDGIV